MKSKRRGEDSFTLVEALAAMTILGIAVASILTTFSASLVAGRAAEDYAAASAMMTELRTYVRANLFTPYETNQGTFTTHPEFSWTATYTPTNYTDFYQVTLTIQWLRGDRQYTHAATTYHYYAVASEEAIEEEQEEAR